MSQNQQLFLLANVVTVNTAANTTSLNNSLVVGNSSVNVVINSSSVYVSGSPVGGATNTAAQYAWTNSQSFSAVVTHTANVSVNGAIIANSVSGTAGQVLTSAGTGNVYWSTASGGGSFSNGASISVANLAITGSVTANGSVGTSGQALVSTGTGVQWGALSPGYNYSSQFNGSSYLSGPSNAAFTFGTGDFTVEAWVYFTTAGTAKGIFANGPTSAGSLNLVILSDNKVYVQCYGGTNLSGTATLSVNTWYHIAATRSSSTMRLFINGVLDASATNAFNNTSSASGVGVSWTGYAPDLFNGFISNLRVVKGTAVYTAAFTPPTSPLSAISGTSLLTCNAITPTSDSSTNNLALTNTGPVTTTATLSPFTSTSVSIPTQSLTSVRQQFTGDGSTTSFAVAGGYTANAISVFVNGVLLRNGTDVTVTNGSTVVFAIAPLNGALIDVIGTVPTTYSSITPVSYSVGFSGTSQALTLAQSTAFDLPADLTVEAWVYFTSFNGTGTENTIVGKWGDSAQYAWIIQYLNTGNLRFYPGNSGSLGTAYSAAWSPSTNTWYHIAFTRSGSSIKFYVNGTQVGTTGTNSDNLTASTVLSIGRNPATGAPQSMFGYVSNLRIVKGVAVYTSNFTVPSSPLSITQSASGAYIQAITGTQTSLLTCNGPTIIDGSTNAFTITNNGSALVSTNIVPLFTNVTITNPTTMYPATYLIVAGGAGGGSNWGGGGGGGGVLTGSTTFVAGTTYTMTVGAGGAYSTNGVNSYINNLGVQAYGGGTGVGALNGNGLNGGSGGGGGGNTSGATTNGGSGIPGQGNAGGGAIANVNPGAGGGGGAAYPGVQSTGTVAGNGGSGILNTITGSSVTYAGGGGGGNGASQTAGTGGAGGGGNGATATGSATTNGSAGTANLGSGGGGGSTNGGLGGSGGSGVIIISIPTTYYTTRTTGSPTVTTNGIYTVLTFTASGTYTA